MVDLSAAADAGDIVAKLKSFIIERALPLWSGEGWDRASGGFVDRLDGEGRADRLAPRRTFVQARQIYCFAKAAQMGWYPEGKAIALKGLDYFLSKAKAPETASARAKLAAKPANAGKGAARSSAKAPAKSAGRLKKAS